MNAKALLIVIIFGIATSAWAAAPTIDQLVANPTLLNTEMDRCKHLGMAANDDARCRTAWQAENKRFFGNGAGTYKSTPVDVFPSHPTINPQPDSQRASSSKSPDHPNGQ